VDSRVPLRPYGSLPFQGAVSKQFKCHVGVLQGSVLLLHLFYSFVSDFPNHAQGNKLFADDFSLSEMSSDIHSLGVTLTGHLRHISDWAKANKLVITPAKSYVTFLTPNTKEANFHPQVFIDGALISLNKRPKWLGNILSSMFKATPHIDAQRGKLSSRIQLLKATSGLDFGDKETLQLTYNTFLKPIIGYNAPVWFPSTDPNVSSI
jgi:hypothetical protein